MSEENFQSWVERTVANREAKPLSSGEVIKSSAGQAFGVVEFARIEQEDFLADVGKKGDFYIYHFYPMPITHEKSLALMDALEKAFPKIFKDNGEVEIDWVPEMNSAAVRVSGWTSHVWGDDLAVRVVDVVQEEINADSKPAG